MSRPDGDGRQMPNRQENAFMIDLMLLRNSIAKNSEAVRDRMKPYPTAWRDIRLLWCLINRLQDQMLDTMPDRKIVYYEKLCQHGKISVDIPGPIPKGRNRLIDEDSLACLAEAALRGECSMCVKDGNDAHQCVIRQALLQVAPPERVNTGKQWWEECEYRHAASALIHDDEITI